MASRVPRPNSGISTQPFWVTGAIQGGRWLAHHLRSESDVDQGREKPEAHDSWPDLQQASLLSGPASQRVLGFVSAFPTQLTRNDPRSWGDSRSPAARDSSRSPALYIGGLAWLTAPGSAPRPGPRVLTSDWLLEIPPPPISADSWKARPVQADLGYFSPVPGLPKRLRTEIPRLGFGWSFCNPAPPSLGGHPSQNSATSLQNWISCLWLALPDSAPPLPLVSSHLAGFQLLSGTLQFLPVHVAAEASWPYLRILVVWVEFASSFFFPRPPFPPAGNTYPRGFASVAEVASNPSCPPKQQEFRSEDLGVWPGSVLHRTWLSRDTGMLERETV